MLLLTFVLHTALFAQITDIPEVTVSAPATQPATAQQQAPAEAESPRSLTDGILKTQLGQIIQGNKQLTWDEIKTWEFWRETVRDLITTLIGFVPRLIGTMIFLTVFWLIYRGIRKLAVSTMKKSDVDSSIRDMLATLIKWAVMGIGIIIACNQLGIPIVAMLTTVSIIGLAIGFAAQETLANFIAGIVIFLDKPFKVGDWLTVDGMFCRVRRISFRSTRLLTEDGEVVVLPNTFMLANKIVNHSDHALQRVNIEIGISYRSSIDDARATLMALCKEDPLGAAAS